jgi:tetratricopeptide (TPR) repeat protein
MLLNICRFAANVGLILLTLVGCTGPSSLSDSHPSLPNSHLIDTPFFPQTSFYCGPASLATVLSFRGIDIDPESLEKIISIPQLKGTLQIEMMAAARGFDLLPYEFNGSLKDLLKEISEDNPVIVIQNLSINLIPKWHYATVVGYNLENKVLILNSGRHQKYQIPIKTFLKTWKRANNWALLINQPSVLPLNAEVNNFLKSASILEETGHSLSALKAYQTALTKWPDNLIAKFGLGNSYYEIENYDKAADIFLHLVDTDKTNANYWNNLAYALQGKGCPDESVISVKNAIELSPGEENYYNSLVEITNLQKQQTDKLISCPKITPLKESRSLKTN